MKVKLFRRRDLGIYKKIIIFFTLDLIRGLSKIFKVDKEDL